MNTLNFFDTEILLNASENWLVRLSNGVVFYMTPHGKHLPVKQEQRNSSGLDEDFWNWGLHTMVLISKRPTEEQIVCIEKAYAEWAQKHSPKKESRTKQTAFLFGDTDVFRKLKDDLDGKFKT